MKAGLARATFLIFLMLMNQLMEIMGFEIGF